MIVKIQPSHSNIKAAVEYNERKMNGAEGIRPSDDPELKGIEDGHILVTRNVPEGSTLTEEFERLTLLNIAKKQRGRELKNLSFHMSVNPAETDKPLSEKEAVTLIDEIMQGLGYEKQPYRIYKHTDIERTHYHVVSCRAGQDGKKVNSDFERLVLRKKLKELSEKYGFELVLSEEEKETEEKAKNKNNAEEINQSQTTPKTAERNGRRKDSEEDETSKKKTFTPAFSRQSDTPVTEQIQVVARDVMNWHFSSFEQIQALMLRRYNVLLEIERKGASEEAVFSGTDKNGRTITPMLNENDIFPGFLRRLTEKAGKEKMHNRREQRTRLEQLAKASAAIAESFDQFKDLMARKGVIVVLSWSRDGKPFGVTYLDRATRCAWKGSETKVDLAWLLGQASKKRWTLTKDVWQQVIEKRAAMPSRKSAPVMPVVTKDPGHESHTTTTKEAPIYLPGHHEESHAKIRGLDDDIEEDKPQELVQ
jgi:hypothetical protein